MTEEDFIARWASDRPVYEAWGNVVVRTVLDELRGMIAPLSADLFLRLPPKPRLKGDASFLEKAFYRGKSYSDPFTDITDKVGVRFVVLLGTDIRTVEQAVTSSDLWTCDKDRDFEEEQNKDPIRFDYSAVHYVVRAKRDVEEEGVRIPKGSPCEVQVKTILQHAWGELTHDTIYKPTINATPQMKRAAAKSMALLEATNDYFEQVSKEVLALYTAEQKISDTLSTIYEGYVGRPPEKSKLEALLVSAMHGALPEDFRTRLDSFLEQNSYISGLIAERAATKLFYRQPSILLCYYFVGSEPLKIKERWPLTVEELMPIFTDMGEAF